MSITNQGNEEEGKVERDDGGDELVAARIFWFRV